MTASSMLRGLAVAIAIAAAAPASAQTRPAPRPSSQPDTFSLRGFADVGGTTFTAAESFNAIFGTRTGIVFGGGVEGVLPQHVFFNVQASRFSKSGSRAFVSDGQVFDLGIPTDVTITPFEINAGYRFAPNRAPIIPYLGGGIGWHRYKETSQFAVTTENVDETFRGYQILGGVEFRLGRLFGAAAEAQWTTVPNALGQNATAVSTAFNETNLGGTTIRGKFVIGR
jgi:opacity protein-like surface antigen